MYARTRSCTRTHTFTYTHAHVHAPRIWIGARFGCVCAWCTPRRRGGHVCACERSLALRFRLSLAPCAPLLRRRRRRQKSGNPPAPPPAAASAGAEHPQHRGIPPSRGPPDRKFSRFFAASQWRPTNNTLSRKTLCPPRSIYTHAHVGDVTVCLMRTSSNIIIHYCNNS